MSKKVIYQCVSKYIDELSDSYLDFLESICNIESNSYDQEGINKVADYIMEHEKTSGYLFERMTFEKAGDCLCIDFVNGPDKPWFALSAHMDTVYKNGAFGCSAVRRDDTFIYGPGVSDCKGGIAVGLLAMAALKKSAYHDCNIRLLLQSDEEVSSSLSNKETIEYICEKAKGCRAFFNLEAKYPGYLTVQRGGIIHAMFTVIGKAAHSKDQQQGANAIHEAALKISDIVRNKLNEEVSFNCGVIEGGEASNVIAAKCSFHVEARIKTRDMYDKVTDFFEELAGKQYVQGTKTEVAIVADRIPMEIKDVNVKLLNQISEISSKYGFGKIEARQSMGGSDAAYTTDADIPTADGMGIVGYNLHSVDEKAQIKSLAESAKLLAAVIMELA